MVVVVQMCRRRHGFSGQRQHAGSGHGNQDNGWEGVAADDAVGDSRRPSGHEGEHGDAAQRADVEDEKFRWRSPSPYFLEHLLFSLKAAEVGDRRPRSLE